MKKILAMFASFAMLGALFSFVPAVSAATITIGNGTAASYGMNALSNNVVLDMSSSIGTPGFISSFNYFAANGNPFNFLVVNNNNMVQWVSPTIYPSLAWGVNSYTFVTPVAINPGWHIGFYFPSTNTIPFQPSGNMVMMTAGNSGMPSAGSTLNLVLQTDWTFSYSATETTSAPVINTGGGGMGGSGTESAIIMSASGDVQLNNNLGGLYSNPQTQTIKFNVSSDTTIPNLGAQGTFSYQDSNGNSYTASVQRATINSSTAYFAGPITSTSNPSWNGQWLYAKVIDNGLGNDEIWFSITDMSSAVSHFTNVNFSDPGNGPFTPSVGDIMIFSIPDQN